MKITKLGHCCLVIEEEKRRGSADPFPSKCLRILTDPGSYSTGQSKVKNIDIILITHEHQDHLHIESLKSVLVNNPKAKVFTNRGVGKILDKEKVRYELLGHGQSKIIDGVWIEGFGDKHADLYTTVPVAINTGYLIAKRFFYPGDAFYNPKKGVEILALPVAGPWMKISEAVDYAKEIKPKICFPVHDGMLLPDRIGAAHRIPQNVLEAMGTKFVVLKEGEEREF